MKKRRISSLLAGVLSIGIALALLLSACTPKPAGTLTVAEAITSTGEVFMSELRGTPTSLSHDIFERLVQYNMVTGQYEPRLATEWSASSDFRTWTFKLRKGVKFHDGTEFTAEDVKFSFDHITQATDPNRPSESRLWATWLDNIEVIDPYTVTFHLKINHFTFLGYLGQFCVSEIISKKYFDSVGLKGYNEQPIGTGPYKFVEWVKGNYWKMEAVPDHWRKVPEFQYLTRLCVPEEATRVAMLRSGQVDIIQISYTSIKEVQQAGFKVVKTPLPIYDKFLILGGQYLKERPTYDPKVPWLDKKVRMAMNFAINRQEIIDTLMLGMANADILPYCNSTTPGWNPEWKVYPYDPARARQLLAEAGYPKGFEFTLKDYSLDIFKDVALAVKSYWDAIGLKCNFQVVDSATMSAQWRARKAAGIVHSATATKRPEIARGTEALCASWGTYGAAESPELDKLFVDAGQARDFKEYERIGRAIMDLIYNEYLTVPIYNSYLLAGVNPKTVGFYELTSNYGYNNMEYAKKP